MRKQTCSYDYDYTQRNIVIKVVYPNVRLSERMALREQIDLCVRVCVRNAFRAASLRCAVGGRFEFEICGFPTKPNLYSKFNGVNGNALNIYIKCNEAQAGPSHS